MACCVGSGDDASEAAANNCCAIGERGKNADTFNGLLSAALPAANPVGSGMASALSIVRTAALASENSGRVRSGSNTHVLLSVFLI